ncbi:hypothetical protein C1H76_4461 [Elsinoe australis]|uniref:Non-homologous end-joining factor 1 n=1 Tax=Elsinoe australis TaxID=40998 RepID=A0A4U7AXU2_9PEZI|nr:hypothetical protein C1H76_4461 [Elsinoe australis]
MALIRSWKPLPAVEEAGSYLVKFEFQESGYRVALTDLRELWEESVDLKAILQKADQLASPIDASESADQRRILFENIANSLSGSPGTSLQVKRRDRDDALLLHLKAPLPQPLPELEWNLVLHLKDPEGFADDITGKLVERLHQRETDVEQLHLFLRDKDHVISRLVDRLESSGTDLTTVFPGTSGVKLSRKVSQRSQLARHVKGLEPFAPSDWKSSTATISDRERLSFVLGSADKGPSSRLLQILEQAADSATSPTSRARHIASDGHTNSQRRTATDDATDSETEDDEFQVQEIPEKPKIGNVEETGSAVIPNNKRSDAGTDTESTNGSMSPPTDASLQVQETKAKPRGRIGVIGRRALKTETDLIPDTAVASSTSLSNVTDNLGIVPQKNSRLGVIGGRRPRAEQPAAEYTSHTGPIEPPVPTDKTDREPAQKSEVDTENAHRGRPAVDTAKPKVSPPRETSQERADRRREELKRQIDTRPLATAKKKRKF